MLVKAVMPERSKAEAHSQAKPRGHNAPAKVVKHRATATQHGSVAVLTNWEGRALMQPRVVQTRSVVAVVPAGDGWLVIQL